MSKILCLSHIFPPAIDGGSRVIYKIGQYFEKQNNQVLYLSSDCSSTDDFTKSKFKKISNIQHLASNIYLPVYHHLRRPLKFINLFLPKSSYLHQLLQIAQKGPIFKIIPFIKATIKIIKFKPDLIIAGPLPTTVVLYANFLKRIINISKNINNFPSFLQRRGLRGRFCKLLINASFHQTDQDFFQKPLIKTLQNADYLWTLTQFETDYFIQNFKINPTKIILAGNGVDQSFLKKSKVPRLVKEGARGRLKILYIGSLSAHKGLNILISSFPRLVKEGVRGRLVLAGQKTLYYPEILKIIKQQPKEVQKNIRFIFKFPQNKLAKIIDSCDILVLPSKQESFGLCLIEAWARQKPVIVSNIPSLSEIVTLSQGGLIFNLDNPTDLTQKITKLIQNPKLYYQLRQNGFNYVKNNYTWSTVGRKIQEKLCL